MWVAEGDCSFEVDGGCITDVGDVNHDFVTNVDDIEQFFHCAVSSLRESGRVSTMGTCVIGLAFGVKSRNNCGRLRTEIGHVNL